MYKMLINSFIVFKIQSYENVHTNTKYLQVGTIFVVVKINESLCMLCKVLLSMLDPLFNDSEVPLLSGYFKLAVLSAFIKNWCSS